ncbi:transposase family protein [Streptomyces sp. NPDC056308]|uniref:helix-turn-helix domain-containing protein n=1 Tax=Streptomyces sp. NPDC056308 TaxID=3345780 RepID=UPI0035D8BBD7
MGVVGNRARAAIIRSRRIIGLAPEVFAELVAEVGPLWHERHQAELVSRPRRRAVGAGAKHKLVFVDRLLATLVNLSHGATHDVLACWFGVDRSTITRAIGEVRPLLAERGCTVASGIRLRTLADVIAAPRATTSTATTAGQTPTGTGPPPAPWPPSATNGRTPRPSPPAACSSWPTCAKACTWPATTA